MVSNNSNEKRYGSLWIMSVWVDTDIYFYAVYKFMINCIVQTLFSLFCTLSETYRGPKFGLTPLPSLRSKAQKVIREILSYIRAQFAFKLGHVNIPTCIVFFHTTLLLTPCYHETCISYLCSIENPPNVHLRNFRRHWKWRPLIAYLWGLQYLKGRKCNFCDKRKLIQCCI